MSRACENSFVKYARKVATATRIKGTVKLLTLVRRRRDIVRMFFILLRRVPSRDWSFLFRAQGWI